MNTKQRRRMEKADTEEIPPYIDANADATAPLPPRGLQPQDTLEILASSADIEETNPQSHARIQIGVRHARGKYEVSVTYRIDEQIGEPFVAMSTDPNQARYKTARAIASRMREQGAESFEIVSYTPRTSASGPQFRTPEQDVITYFEREIKRNLNAYAKKDSAEKTSDGF